LLSEIIDGCRRRDRKNQKELYQMFYAYGMSITMRYADSREKASQVLNDSFMKVFSNIKKYDRHRPFKPWFRQIIVNTAINHVHKEQRQMNLENFDDYREELSSDQTIISGLSYQEIIDMMQKLTPAYRTVFNLYVIDGFKHHEIAEMLDISVGTSKSNLFKAKRNLRTMLENNLM